MEVRYTYLTRSSPGTGVTIHDRAVMRLEPRLDVIRAPGSTPARPPRADDTPMSRGQRLRAGRRRGVTVVEYSLIVSLFLFATIGAVKR